MKAVIRPGDASGWVAECVEVPVVTQGATLDEILDLDDPTRTGFEDHNADAVLLAALNAAWEASYGGASP